MNHKALINRFVWPGLSFCVKLDNIFFWNDENNLFSSATLNLVFHLSIGFSSPAQQRLSIAFNTAIATSQDERKQKVVKQQNCQNVCQTNYADTFDTSDFDSNFPYQLPHVFAAPNTTGDSQSTSTHNTSESTKDVETLFCGQIFLRLTFFYG